MKAELYNLAQTVAYLTPMHRWFGLGRLSYDQSYWDQQLSGPFKPYLGGTVSIEMRNSIVLALVRKLLPKQGCRLLDVGCAAGSLAQAPGADHFRYIGVDISSVAIEQARAQSPDREFHVAKLEDYLPLQEQHVIILNEVLYYLTVENALIQLQRYAGFLSPDGLLVVSMKNAPKSKAIISGCSEHFEWVNGILWQEKIDGPDYAIRKDAKRQGFLMSVLRPRKTHASNASA